VEYVSSGVGSLATNADRLIPIARSTVLCILLPRLLSIAITMAIMIELEPIGIKVNLVSPGFTKTNLNGFESF
jgi:hypothetical protein